VTLPGDLRLRAVSAFWAVCAIAPIAEPAAAATAVLAVLGLYAAVGAPLPWRRLLHLEGFLILLLLTLPFTIPGSPILQIGPLAASAEGLWRALTLAAKVTASVLLISLLLGTADPMRLAVALRALRLPEALVRLFVSVTRYLALVRGEFARLHEAMRARGFRPGSNRHTWRSYGNLVGMLLVRAMERADRVEEAMRLRGYSGRFPRTALPAPALADWLFALAIAASATLLLAWDMA